MDVKLVLLSILRDLKQNSPLAELKRSVEPKDSGDKSAESEKDIDLWDELEKDPELFQKIALEVQAEIKKGKSEMEAGMEVMQKYKDKLQSLM